MVEIAVGAYEDEVGDDRNADDEEEEDGPGKQSGAAIVGLVEPEDDAEEGETRRRKLRVEQMFPRSLL